MSNLTNIRMVLGTPKAIKENPIDIKTICFCMESEDNDFPIGNYNFNLKCWENTKQECQLDSTFIWNRTYCDVDWFIRAFRQAGWHIPVYCWESTMDINKLPWNDNTEDGESDDVNWNDMAEHGLVVMPQRQLLM